MLLSDKTKKLLEAEGLTQENISDLSNFISSDPVVDKIFEGYIQLTEQNRKLLKKFIAFLYQEQQTAENNIN